MPPPTGCSTKCWMWRRGGRPRPSVSVIASSRFIAGIRRSERRGGETADEERKDRKGHALCVRRGLALGARRATMAMPNLRSDQPIEAAVRRVGSFRWVICGLLFLAATINYVD